MRNNKSIKNNKLYQVVNERGRKLICFFQLPGVMKDSNSKQIISHWQTDLYEVTRKVSANFETRELIDN
jgi:hypothetical protein